MEVFSQEGFKILFNKNWTITNLAAETERIDRELLLFEFHKLAKTAPRRAENGKKIFSDERNGSVSTKQRIDDSATGNRKRFEEHLAMALWNCKANWPCSRVEAFQLLDYQFPLKSALSDKGIGKIDLLGLTDRGRTTIPKRIREALDLREGDVIAFNVENANLLVRKLIPEHDEILKGVGGSFCEWVSPEDEQAWRDL